MDFLKLENFSNVAPGGLATVELAAGQRGYAYHSVLLKILSGSGTPMSRSNMEKLIESVRLVINGAGYNNDRIWELSGANLLAHNDFYGLTMKDGLLELNFAAPYWDNPANESRMKLGTADLQTVHIQVKLKNTVTNPEITGNAYVYPQNENFGRFIRLEEFVRDNNETGRIQISDLPVQGPGFGLKAVHFVTDKIGEITLKDGTVPFYEDEPFYRDVLLEKNAFRTQGRNQQEGFTHIDIAGNSYARIKGTGTMGRFYIDMERTGTGAFTILTEVVVGTDIPITQ